MQMIDRRTDSVGYLVNWAARLLTRALERRLAGGSPGPMPVYYALYDGAALPQRDLAQFAAVEQPTMANTLARMERDGLITTRPDPQDGRSRLIELTPLGRERAQAGLAAAGATNRLALEALTVDEAPVFMDMLRRVVAHLEADQG